MIKSTLLYNSPITKNIFSNLQKENKTIITEVSGKSISSFDFSNNILNVAKNLSDFWVRKNHSVVILAKDNILFWNLIISSILTWAQIVLLDPAMGQKVMIEKIKASKVTHIILEWILYDYLYVTKSEILKMDIEFVINSWSIFGNKYKKVKSLLQEITSEIIFQDADENLAALTVFTGGTTGNPKWVVHSLASIFQMLEKIKYFIWNTKVFYADMPHFLLLGLLTDACIISGPYNLKPKKLKKILEKFEIDTYFCPPYKYNYFIERNLKVPKTLQNMLLGSAPIYSWFLEKLLPLLENSQKVTCVYGMTEMLPIASVDVRENVTSKIEWVLLWDLLSDISYKIVDSELYVQWLHQMLHYLWYETKEMIATGDLVKVENNKLIMIGRKKDMIIKQEYNIYPWVYEPIISKIPGVFACALVWIYDEKINDERIILFLEISHSQEKFNRNYIINRLKSGEYSIDACALPDEIIFGIIPRIGRQEKIDKNKLREIYLRK